MSKVMESNQNCAIYVRKSTIDIRESGGRSISGQLKDCKALAEQKGMKVVEVFEEAEGISASPYSNQARPQFENALNAIGKGFKNLIVWGLDRSSRKGFEEVGQILTTLEERGGRMISFQDQIDTLDMDMAARLRLIIQAEFAKNESDMLSSRIGRGKQTQRDRRLHQGGPTCMGVKIVREEGKPERIELVPEEVEIIHRMRDMLLKEDMSTNAVASALRDEGIRNKYGRFFHAVTIRNILRNPTMVGQRAELGDVVRDENDEPIVFHDPILTEEEFLEVDRAISKRNVSYQNGKSKAGVETKLLTGLIYCERCELNARSTLSGSGIRYYVCAQGCQATHPYDAANNFVVNAALARLSKIAHENPTSEVVQDIGRRWLGIVDPEHQKNEFKNLEELSDLKERLERLNSDFYEFGKIEEAQFFKIQKSLTTKIEKLEKSLEKVDEVLDLGALTDLVSVNNSDGENPFDLAGEGSAWSQLKPEAQRKIMYLLVERIVIADFKKGPKPTTKTPFEQRVKEIDFHI
jgi:site-specific DNA recombinase